MSSRLNRIPRIAPAGLLDTLACALYGALCSLKTWHAQRTAERLVREIDALRSHMQVDDWMRELHLTHGHSTDGIDRRAAQDHRQLEQLQTAHQRVQQRLNTFC